MCILGARTDICWVVGYARRWTECPERGGERNQSLRCPGYSGAALRVNGTQRQNGTTHHASQQPAQRPAAAGRRASTPRRSHPDVHGCVTIHLSIYSTTYQGIRSTHLPIFEYFFSTNALEPKCSATYLFEGLVWVVGGIAREGRHDRPTDSSDSLYSRDANTPIPYQYHHALHVINNSYSYSGVVAFACICIMATHDSSPSNHEERAFTCS